MSWREELKPSDRVVVMRGHFMGPVVGSVERVTPKQVIVGGERYWKGNGRRVGAERRSYRIERWTQEWQDTNDKRRLYVKMRYSVEWEDIPLSKLRRIEGILEEECSI